MCAYYPESKVEVSGFVAKHYDKLMDLLTFGSYPAFIKKAIRLMRIKPTDKILDFGSGTGRNACLMNKDLSENGEIIGLDISEEMMAQFRKKCSKFPNVKIVEARIDEELPYKNYFDKAFISFVLHGFPQDVRERIIENAARALKNRGEFFILDYNEFSLKDAPLYARLAFKLIECPYAFDFIEKDWKKILRSHGFSDFGEHRFFGKYIRLLKGIKTE